MRLFVEKKDNIVIKTFFILWSDTIYLLFMNIIAHPVLFNTALYTLINILTWTISSFYDAIWGDHRVLFWHLLCLWITCHHPVSPISSGLVTFCTVLFLVYTITIKLTCEICQWTRKCVVHFTPFRIRSGSIQLKAKFPSLGCPLHVILKWKSFSMPSVPKIWEDTE